MPNQAVLERIACLDVQDLPAVDLVPNTSLQPPHTVYISAANIHGLETISQWGEQAKAELLKHQDFFQTLPCCDYADESEFQSLITGIAAQLTQAPIADLRIDFEDGFTQTDVPVDSRNADEDSHALRVGGILSALLKQTTMRVGIRIKPLEPRSAQRSLRTLRLVLETAQFGISQAPDRFRITLPKISDSQQLALLQQMLSEFEQELQLPQLDVEAQIELPHALIHPTTGQVHLNALILAGAGRIRALHYGTYDYAAALGVDPQYQAMDHPVADTALSIMQMVAAQHDVELSHGSTNILPRGTESIKQQAWLEHARLVQRAYQRGIRQGWDLHPGQLITRYLVSFAYYRRSSAEYLERIANFVQRKDTTIAEEPATIRPLVAFVLRGVQLQAISEADVHAYGLQIAEIKNLLEQV